MATNLKKVNSFFQKTLQSFASSLLNCHCNVGYLLHEAGYLLLY
ncbi:hypothetical protein HMPREF0556_11903 [Listeria grayi DSM 20601]|uniref:Uncharacterized protein n=1 Tax=Listeria grayi DSM 20601 TaxID=525367 RepID=D7V0Y6_LISGR|nr:hypothetical protein HMPREF0556_11903 [Listeria grayi DSM 20601]